MPYIAGKIYPDRTFSLGFVPSPKITRQDKTYEEEYQDQYDYYNYTTKKYGRTEFHTERFFAVTGVPRGFTKGLESSQKSLPQKYGRNGISSYGKKTVSNAALLMQREFGCSRINFVTCTLPGYSDYALRCINQNWNHIVRKFFQAVRRDLKKANAPIEYVSVTEIQEKRMASGRGVALHLHFAYVCRPLGSWKYYISIKRMTELWRRQVQNVLCIHAPDELHGCNDFNNSVDMCIVKKSVAGYLGKYMSKGSKVTEEIINNGLEDCLPSQWWTASMQTKEKLKKAIIQVCTVIGKEMFYNVQDFVKKGEITRWTYVEREFNGEMRIFGMAGSVSGQLYQYLKLYYSCR